MSAIAATFCAFRTVAGRKQLQLVFEAPVEQTEQILKLLGYPDPGGSKWVGIAPLDLGKKQEAPAERATARKTVKQAWSEMKLSARAGIICNDPELWKWANSKMGRSTGLYIHNETEAATWLRFRTNVTSRKEYDTDPRAAQRYLSVEKEFLAHKSDVERYGQ